VGVGVATDHQSRGSACHETKLPPHPSPLLPLLIPPSCSPYLFFPLPQKIGKRPTDISVVSVMPCVRKQGEADRMMFHTPDGGSR